MKDFKKNKHLLTNEKLEEIEKLLNDIKNSIKNDINENVNNNKIKNGLINENKIEHKNFDYVEEITKKYLYYYILMKKLFSKK